MSGKNFMLGAATSAHQVEGNNVNSDCWAIEQLENSAFKEPSLDAVDHYNRYKEDLKLLKEAGLNTYRFTVEWARIEPEKGRYSEKAVKHYIEKLQFCHELGITPVITLHHFSSPMWISKAGGWENEEIISHFESYVRYIIKELGKYVSYVCTINEANMGAQIAKMMKKMSQGKKDNAGSVQVGLNKNMVNKMEKYNEELNKTYGVDPRRFNTFLSPKTEKGNHIIFTAHERARDAIKEIYPDIKVGVTLSLHDNQALEGGEKYVHKENQEELLDYLTYLKKDDFIGIQNYSRQVFDKNGLKKVDEGARVTKMGYEFYPEALGNVVRFVSRHWNKDIFITENGISTDNDKERIEFIERALNGLKKCIEEDIPVIGYTYWSLLDNFEWQIGYEQKFGLIEVDRKTQNRYPKESLKFLGNCNKRIGEKVTT